MTNDAHHMTAPRPDGSQAARAMRLALERRDIQAERDRIHQCARQLDPAQRSDRDAGDRNVFGDAANTVLASGTKGYYGHALGASGAIEAAICALAIDREWLPPTVNLAERDPACDLNYIAGTGREQRVEHVLSNSFGFGGINAALVFRRVV